MDLPFKAEYAKSGRASCKGCRTPIPAGSLRLAAMLQSAFFDGKQANWYHEKCFFTKQRPKSIGDFANIETLRYEDQEKVRKAIEENSSGIVSAAVKPAKGKGKKRAGTDADGAAALKDFAVEYSKSSRATCKVCDLKIVKDEIRICKKVFDTEIGQKFGGQPLWHHVECFAKDRANLLFFACGDVLPGFNSLKKEDKTIVKAALPALKQDEVPVKKLKEEPKDKEEKKATGDLEIQLKNQNKIYFKYRDLLKSNLGKTELQQLLEYNKQEVPAGIDRILDLLADCMTFGSLLPCNVCKNGQLKLSTNGYACLGNLTEWTKCQNVTQTPDRAPFKIIKDLKDNPAFKKYKFKSNVRKFRDIPPSAPLVKTENELQKLKSEIPIPPLKNLTFFIYGLSKKIKDDLKIKILKMGGIVSSKVTENLAAVISNESEIEKSSSSMESIKANDIQVLDKSFLDVIQPNFTIAESINLIEEKNIAPWGSQLSTRLSQDVIDGKSVPKSKSIYEKSSSSKTKLTVKEGTAVDPESGLEDVAHVYVSPSKIKYSTVLGKTDIVSQKNSFYKLQILESDHGKKYWVFRSWGRIGTTIGGNKLEKFSSLDDAKDSFEELYLDKAGHIWVDGKIDSHPKIPGKLYPIEVEYSSDKTDSIVTDDGKSKLPKPLQELIKTIFNVASMKKVMMEFELDTEKLPLGNLSRKQLTSGYSVLTELQKLLEKQKSSDDKSLQPKIIDATNRFYTLIPHSFGIENPPLLDNEEAIKTKTSMLDNLMEIEIAYTLLQKDSDQTDISMLDSHYLKLKCEIEPLARNHPEFELLSNYTKNTHAQTHSGYSLEILEIFKVNREGEDKRYKPFKKLPNRHLLWHGSRTTNFAGILSQGLRIAPPEAPVTGYMFGKGIYFADMVSKSANYCCTSTNSPVGVLLLCEVALGNMHELTAAKTIVKPPSGFNSVKGVGMTEPNPEENHILDCGTIVPLGKPIKKKVQTSLLYNEYIVYDVAQVNVKYLLQMKFNYKY